MRARACVCVCVRACVRVCLLCVQDQEGATALAAAAQSGHVQCVRQLLENSIDTIDMSINNGATPLFLAAQEGHVDIVSTLVKVCLACVARSSTATHKQKIAEPSPHPISVESNSIAVVLRACVFVRVACAQANADLELAREDECSPLAIASQENHVEIVRVLIDAKADPLHKTSEGHSPL